jgi:uncharacterized protein YyaL (SSP411 family)
MLEAVSATADPRVIVQIVPAGASLAEGHPAQGKSAVDDKVTLYICRGQTCSLPVTERIHVKHTIEAA